MQPIAAALKRASAVALPILLQSMLAQSAQAGFNDPIGEFKTKNRPRNRTRNKTRYRTRNRVRNRTKKRTRDRTRNIRLSWASCKIDSNASNFCTNAPHVLTVKRRMKMKSHSLNYYHLANQKFSLTLLPLSFYLSWFFFLHFFSHSSHISSHIFWHYSKRAETWSYWCGIRIKRKQCWLQISKRRNKRIN